jgi:PAS domain S-box-containing protein
MLKSRFSYEVRVRIFILLLAGFLIVAELGMISLFKQTETALMNEIDKRLSFTGFLVKEEVESALKNVKEREDLFAREWIQSLQKRLKTLSLASQYTRIYLIEPQGRILIDSHDAEVPLREVFARETDLEGYRSVLESGNEEPITYSIEKSRIHFLPVHSFPNLLGDKPWVIGVRSDVSFLSIVEGLSRFNLMMKGVGVVLVVLLVFFFLASIAKPFRRMRLAALGIGEMGAGEEEAAFVERTFQKVIEELKKKEAIVRELYEKEQKKTESLEEYNQYILSSVSSGIIGVDTDGQITCFNRAASMILGMDGENFLGRQYRDVLGNNELSHILEDAVQKKETCSLHEVALPAGRGWVRATSSLLKDPSDTFQGATLLFTDITRIKKLEAEIYLKERLASLGEMSAGIAHEFKNSLGTITGYTQLLQKKLKMKNRGEREEEVVNQILKESSALNYVVKQFLDFAGPTRLHLEKVELNQLLRECCELDSPEPEGEEKQTLSIDLHLEKHLPMIEGDKSLLKSAFFNLIQNAKEAMPEGGILTLSTKKLSNSSVIEITCKDTGGGIPKEELKKVFTPFFSTRDEGAGLGLSLTHKIISEHHGRIDIESEVGKGTMVIVELPYTND